MAKTRKLGKDLLHIEAEGCVVNIRENLEDRRGRKVTHVEVRCDDYAGENPWRLNGGKHRFHSMRIVQLKGKSRRR